MPSQPRSAESSNPGQGLTLAELATAKGLPVEFLQQHGLRDDRSYGRPAVAMPYADEHDHHVLDRYRIALTGDRFRQPAGVALLPGSRTLSGTDLIAVPAVGPGTAGRYPTEKPEGLGRHLAAVAGVGPGDVVLDPFCGSGALLVGAHARGAAVIGCDIAAVALRRAAGKLGLDRSAAPAATATPRRASGGGGRTSRPPSRDG